MISLQTPKQILSEETLPKKRKIWDDHPAQETSGQKQQKIETTNPVSDSSYLKSQPQFPLEWQRCLDIKSGQVYFYNTRTHVKRATLEGYNNNSNDNRAPMSLELELNLPSQSLGKHHDFGTTTTYSNNHFTSSTEAGLTTKSPSWLTIERDEQEEMVTAVCRKCYMLVMMCKSSPTCPNCKFMHPNMEPISHPFNKSTS